jgi:ectoine hydroxylase-related dioxygenase (phytanoyl-CoA dioxygenase family)
MIPAPGAEPVESPPRRLSETELLQFREQGYLVIENLLEAGEIDSVVRHVDADVNRRAEAAVAAGRLPRTYREEGFERQLAHITEHDRSMVQAIWQEGFTHESIFALIRSARLLAIAEQLCGSEELVAANGFWVRPKVPNEKTFEFPWHQDAGYAHPLCDQSFVLCVWIPLVDATEERGCLWTRPYAHVPGAILPHRRSRKNPTIAIDPEALAHLPMRCVPVRKGGAVLMHNLTPHASGPNRSDVVRWSFDVRYQSASAPTNAAFTRLAGDFAPRSDDELRDGCLPSEIDFLVQSRRRPEEVVSRAEDWIRLRNNFARRPPAERWPQQ